VAQAWAQQLPVPLTPHTPEAQAWLKVQCAPGGSRSLLPVVPPELPEVTDGSLTVWSHPSARRERLVKIANGRRMGILCPETREPNRLSNTDPETAALAPIRRSPRPAWLGATVGH